MNGMKSIRFPHPVADEMVRAILDGRKTVTRLVMKPQPREIYHGGTLFDYDGDLIALVENQNGILEQSVAPYRPGDILYVREKWQYAYELDGNDQAIEGTGRYLYAADENNPSCGYWVMPDGTRRDSMPWRPSIHMSREADRLFLRVTDVRVERLQKMTDDDFVCDFGVCRNAIQAVGRDALAIPFWDSTIKPTDRALYGWAANPWVWVIKFERCRKPEEKPPVGDVGNG